MTPDRDGILSEEELALIKQVQRSRIWRLCMDALCHRREELFADEPASTEELWQNRGAIKEVQRLLREGPLLMVYYRRYMAEQAEGKARERAERVQTAEPGEREYATPGASEEAPQLDMP